MNIANKLTVFRVILVPFFVFFMLTDFIPHSQIIAFVIFVVATITDKLDGTIARKCNMISAFGKFMDPIADKLLVCSALVCLTSSGKIPSWITIIIIGREFAISGVRLLAAEGGVTIAASNWGKLKTIAQMIMTIIMLADIEALRIVEEIVMYAALVLTIISLVDYILKNKAIITIKDM